MKPKVLGLALGGALLYLFEEPHAGEGPVALDGAGGDAENAGDFFDGEAAEVAHLHHLGLAGVQFLEAREGVL